MVETPIHCANCGCKLRPNYETVWRQIQTENGLSGEFWYTGKIRSQGIGDTFCTNACAIRFGFRCVRAGVRLERYDVTVRELRREGRERSKQRRKESHG